MNVKLYIRVKVCFELAVWRGKPANCSFPLDDFSSLLFFSSFGLHSSSSYLEATTTTTTLVEDNFAPQMKLMTFLDIYRNSILQIKVFSFLIVVVVSFEVGVVGVVHDDDEFGPKKERKKEKVFY